MSTEVTTGRARRLMGSNALLLVGGVIAVLGAAWWAFDADPARGRWLLLIGAVVMVVALAVMNRLSASGQKVLLAIALVLAVLAVVDAVQLVQTINEQRSTRDA
jgi:predicted MFS family arabinose efflux permease